MQPFTPAAPANVSDVTEWEYAELIEQGEVLQAELRDLRAERDRLRTDLRVAQLWVKELALWLDEAQARTRGTALGPEGLALAPEALVALQERNAEQTSWRRVAFIGAVVTAPWAILAGLAWLVSAGL